MKGMVFRMIGIKIKVKIVDIIMVCDYGYIEMYVMIRDDGLCFEVILLYLCIVL